MPITLPANPYVVVYDYRLQFDLTDGTLKIDLSPMVLGTTPIQVGNVAFTIQAPDGTISSLGPIFTPGNLNAIYSWPLPRVQNIVMWGLYTVTGTLSANQQWELIKKFNLCAPDAKNPYASEMTGTIVLTTDCNMGTLTASGFCGYGYKQQPPISEAYNMTRYYPPEAELLPQKNLSVIPFVVDAYIGLNRVKGVNASTYDFGDQVFAIIRIVASTDKNIRCGLDMDSIYCGMTALLDRLAACNATAMDYNVAFGEINALIWTCTVGVQENKDVEQYIERLEKLLGVECYCKACAGEKVGPTCVPACPQVTDAKAIVDAGNKILRISFNSAPLLPGSQLNIKYRNFCDPAVNTPWTDYGNHNVVHNAEVYNIPVPDPTSFEILLTTINPDGTHCPPVTIYVVGVCPDVVGINVPPPLASFTADWGWSNVPFTPSNVGASIYLVSGIFTQGAEIDADFAGAPQNTSFLVLRYPLSEPVKTQWINTAFNYGSIPDQIFDAYSDSIYNYIFSVVKPTLDQINQVIKFKK